MRLVFVDRYILCIIISVNLLSMTKQIKKRATKELKEERVCSCRERKKREGEKTELLKIDEG